MFATADEGAMNGGTRGFTIFDTDGKVVYTSKSDVEDLIISLGQYPEHRAGKVREFCSFILVDLLVTLSSQRKWAMNHQVSLW